MKKILIATDLSPNSDRALERAVKLSKEKAAVMHIIHVLPNYKDVVLRSSLEQSTRDLIEKYLNEIPDALDIEIEIHIAQGGNTSIRILEYAFGIKTDIIILGTHKHPELRDLFIGTTVERVARCTLCPLLVVKNKPTGAYQSIVSAIDYAPASRSALRTAMEISPKAVFEIVHTYELYEAYPMTASQALQLFEQGEEKQQKAIIAFVDTELAHFKKSHGGSSKRLPYKLIEGSTYSILLDEIESKKVDLITLGAHGASFLTPSKLGGIAEDILSNPPCDTLLVRE